MEFYKRTITADQIAKFVDAETSFLDRDTRVTVNLSTASKKLRHYHTWLLSTKVGLLDKETGETATGRDIAEKLAAIGASTGGGTRRGDDLGLRRARGGTVYYTDAGRRNAVAARLDWLLSAVFDGDAAARGGRPLMPIAPSTLPLPPS